MLKQLHYDFKKVGYQKKYLMIWLAILLFSIVYAGFLSPRGLPVHEVVQNGLLNYRPVYWLISCYIICDIISSDYHNKTLKVTILYSKSRTCYIASKSVAAVCIGFFALLVHLLGIATTVYMLAPNFEWIGWDQSLTMASIGAISALLFLTSIFVFCMIVTENEAVTIGFAMGIVIIMLILESIEQISKYIPTMQVITLQEIFQANSRLGIGIVGILVFFAVFCSLLTISIFRRKDLFV